jgi:hypothetical protein
MKSFVLRKKLNDDKLVRDQGVPVTPYISSFRNALTVLEKSSTSGGLRENAADPQTGAAGNQKPGEKVRRCPALCSFQV